MPQPSPRIAYLSAGAAGMFCGSCMRDNTLAAALSRLGIDIQLIPTYTPIRTDEENVSIDRIFYGGINIFLQQKWAFFRSLPSFLDRWLDRPWLISRLASRGISVEARELGALAISMLKGESGYQRKEVGRLVDYLDRSVRPDLVNLSNILIAGCVPAIKRRLGVPILVTLQGDDSFLGDLPEPYQNASLAEIRRIAADVDGYIVFSRYYADFMADYLQLPRDRFHLVPMGLNLDDFRSGGRAVSDPSPPTVGFLARICPAKGLHVLIDAFGKLCRMPGTEDTKLRVAGWLGPSDRDYFEKQIEKLRVLGLADSFEYIGQPDRTEKIDFLGGLDLLSVPTTYKEPKGIYVLEALASGVAVVQPEHGAFPELLAATGGGRLFRPNDSEHLAETLHDLLTDHASRAELAQAGMKTVHEKFAAEAMARRTLEVYRQYCE